MSNNKRYWIIMCPSCGRWQSCWVVRPKNYTFTCRRCNHTTKLWKERTRGIGLHHKTVVGGREAAAACARLNERKQ